MHVDTHALWIDPNDPEHMVIGNDGGISITCDGGGTWDFGEYFPIGQFYEVSYDYRVPYHICGGAQDNGSWCGPSRRKTARPTTTTGSRSPAATASTRSRTRPTRGSSGRSRRAATSSARTCARVRASPLAKPGYRQRYLMLEDSIMMVRGDTMRPPTRELQRQLADMRSRQMADSIEWSMRYNWNTPFFLSPHNPDVFYMGGNRVLKSN